MNAAEIVNRNKLVKMLAGSLAYGTNLPTSDVDYRGIFCAEKIHVMTPFFNIREYDDTSEEDTKYYELTQFLKLIVDCNPNILELLWTDDSDIVYRTPAYDMLRNERHKLLSSKVAFTFSGYAISQLKRIKGHKKWLVQEETGLQLLKNALHQQIITDEWIENHVTSDMISKLDRFSLNSSDEISIAGLFKNPNVQLVLSQPPNPKQFVRTLVQFDTMFNIELGGNYVFASYGNETYGVYKHLHSQLFNTNGSLNISDHINKNNDLPVAIVKFNKDDYKVATDRYKQFYEWKKNRNPLRHEMEEKFSYDGKHAMHLIRLLRMGMEILKTGEVLVKRPDAKELLEIRNGKLTYDELIKYASDMDEQIRSVWYKKTKLQHKINLNDAAKILMNVQQCVWENNN